MIDLRHRFIETNGIRMHVADAGPEDGPLVILCHGFPESWYSWRHQLSALGAAGYRAVAPDMRGYGQTDAPEDLRSYTMLHHAGDMVGLADALGARQAVIVGHDWGAPVAWNSALFRPDRFRAVAGLGVPFLPRGPASTVKTMEAAMAGRWFYFLYFQEPGKAEAELSGHVEAFLRGFFWSLSAGPPPSPLRGLIGPAGTKGILEVLDQPAQLPGWLTAEDLAFYVKEFERTGFRGGLNWYRAEPLTWELSAAWADRRIEQPALFVTGDREPVLAMAPGVLEAMAQLVPGLRRTVVLPDCGHWTQQERPAEVNAALLDFLAGL